MKVYVLRNCPVDMTSSNEFVWPESGFVECPDWDSNPSCGKGLHGFLWGKGDSSLLYEGDCKYLIVEVDENLIVDLNGKVKFPQGNVVFCTTDKFAAGAKMIEFGADPTTCMFSQVTSGDGGTSITGYYGNSVSGRTGYSNSGLWGTSISGDRGKSISDDCGTSVTGDWGTSISGNHGFSTSGDRGKSTSGHNGISISGAYGFSTSGHCGTVQTGIDGTCILMHYTEKIGFTEKVLTNPKPNVKYKLNNDGKFVEKDTLLHDKRFIILRKYE